MIIDGEIPDKLAPPVLQERGLARGVRNTRRTHVITLSLHSTASHSYHTRRSYLSVQARRAEHRIPAKAYYFSVTFTPFSTFSLSIAAWVMGLLDTSVPNSHPIRSRSHSRWVAERRKGSGLSPIFLAGVLADDPMKRSDWYLARRGYCEARETYFSRA